jgi:hypothetical protein
MSAQTIATTLTLAAALTGTALILTRHARTGGALTTAAFLTLAALFLRADDTTASGIFLTAAACAAAITASALTHRGTR